MSKNLKIFLIVCSIVLTSGCSWFGSKKHSVEQPTELKPIENKVQLNIIKKVSIGDGTIFNHVKLSPFVIENEVYLASRDGNVVAYNLETGDVLWESSLKTQLSSGPHAAGDKIYVCDSSGNVTALNRISGKQVWRVKLSSEILSRTVESDGYLVVRTADGSIFALDSDTGKQQWVFDRSMPVLTLRGTSDPVIASGIVYAGLDSGKLVAIDLLSGTAIWEQQVAIGRGRSEVERMVDIDGTPEINGGKIYLSSYRAKLGAYSLRDGREFWSRDLSSYNGPAVDTAADGKSLFITDEEGNVWGISADSGASLWKQTSLKFRKTTKPAVKDSFIVIGDLDGYIHLLDKVTGEIVARIEVFDSIIRQQPVIYNNYILVQNEEGQAAVVKVEH